MTKSVNDNPFFGHFNNVYKKSFIIILEDYYLWISKNYLVMKEKL